MFSGSDSDTPKKFQTDGEKKSGEQAFNKGSESIQGAARRTADRRLPGT
jgi:hypothetical protein